MTDEPTFGAYGEPTNPNHRLHLTDGRWHDDCPACLRRRASGGTGDEPTDLRAEDERTGTYVPWYEENKALRAALARSEAEVELRCAERDEALHRATFNAKLADQRFVETSKAKAREAALEKALVYIEDRTATFDCGCELHPLTICPMHAALDTTDDPAT